MRKRDFELGERGRNDRFHPREMPYMDPMDAITYRDSRGRVTDGELQAAFSFALRDDVPDDKLHLCLQLFVEMEARDRAYGKL